MESNNKVAYILSGPPGIGKSTYAREIQKQYNYINILSSDAIRIELLGALKHEDAHTPLIHDVVFGILEDRMLAQTSSFIYDATNLSRKRRRVLYELIKVKMKDFKVVVVVFTNPLHIILEQNEKRAGLDSHVDSEVIIQMYQQQQPPKVGVDCDEIILAKHIPFFKENTSIHNFYNDLINLAPILITIKHHVNEEWAKELLLIDTPHDTPYHLESVSEHIDMCIKAAVLKTINWGYDPLVLAAAFHDLGKGIAKEGGRFYRHENMSAMYTMVAFNEYNWDTLIDIVLYHMLTHNGISNKVINNYKLDEITLNYLEKFNKIDNESRITKLDD